MLEEKQTYRFRVIRKITLPDDSANWVLTCDGTDRYLLPEEYYTDYQIREGMELPCRVDKINCTGRIFLEPEHPWYREGERYLFRYCGSEMHHDRLGNAFLKLVFQGIQGENQIHLSQGIPAGLTPEQPVEVTIRRIRKGTVEFDLKGEGPHQLLQTGGFYTFTVQQQQEDGSLLVAGPGGVTALLDAGYYAPYRLLPGSSFRGEVRGRSANGDLLVEPEHPVYKSGEVYQFMVKRSEPAENGQKIPGRVLVVTDCFGHEIKVLMPFAGQDVFSGPSSIACRVERFKKGRPVLRMASPA
ncbi:MAG TPA: hypothetical protein P5228_03510 [Bacteroidales bacterium]|nr:hypothetical protein [Bacteroidales bacterium]HRZ47994.1 hypothetical protein [Bacteroidales bacterium]